jgi:hypothetical protein
MGSGMTGAFYTTVNALAISGTNLYAGGNFTAAGGVPVNYIAQWDGSAWSPLGSGVNTFWRSGKVSALAVSGNSLYAGGFFTMAGTNVSAFVAEAILPSPPLILTTDGNFGFTNGRSQFGFNVSAPGDTGQALVILASTNLMNWAALQTNVLGGPLFYFSDPSASNFVQRFYRTELLP